MKTQILLMMVLSWSSNAAAEEKSPENWDGFVAIRVGAPFFGIEYINAESNIFQIWAFQFGVYSDSKWSGELECEVFAHPQGGNGYGLTGRFGRTFQLHGPKPWQSGLKGYFVPLLAYQYANRPIHGSADYKALNYTAHIVGVQLAYDLNWGVGGFSLRFFSGFDVALSAEKNEGPWAYANYEPMQWGVKAGFRIGYNSSF